MLSCCLLVALVVSQICLASDRIWYYFTRILHMNLLMSFSEGIQAQDLIPGTHDFLINSFLVCGHKHKELVAKWWGWLTNVRELPHCTWKAMHSVTAVHRRLKEKSVSLSCQVLMYTRGMVSVYFPPESHYPGQECNYLLGYHLYTLTLYVAITNSYIICSMIFSHLHLSTYALLADWVVHKKITSCLLNHVCMST